ncbi:MAG TPA: T9SS type A sorting domain-containing protein, partial [Chitinophagaceae bacterium]|nr:T9SS type A sorting domain-containing protein [Chitinophagaceae bacterium]
DVRFRFVLSSDVAVNYEGVGIDDIHIFDKAPVYVGADTTVPSQNVSGNNWIDFNINGNRIASINPNGQNLGSTSVSVYFNNGAVRTSNNQYYLDRNIVIQPTNQPTADVGVRYYFTDSEANRLIYATGCPACSGIYDAYDAGITKFSGTLSEENGTLADNITGLYNFITPDSVSVIPNDNGYYAAFHVNSFSEFWIDSGGRSGLSPLLITLADFIATKDNNNAMLNWTTIRESDANKFVIERSSNGINFTDIGEVAAMGNANPGNAYRFIDATPLPGINYYRLRLVDNSNNVTYSLVRQLTFNNMVSAVKVFPNPVTQGTMTVSTADECRQIELLDIIGQHLKTFATSGFNTTIHIGKLPQGVYQLKVFTISGIQTVSINVE